MYVQTRLKYDEIKTWFRVFLCYTARKTDHIYSVVLEDKLFLYLLVGLSACDAIFLMARLTL